ncbi:MAG: hypothetical protein WBP40_02430, partial [Candidatus Moraniibacteriota bacterium]
GPLAFIDHYLYVAPAPRGSGGEKKMKKVIVGICTLLFAASVLAGPSVFVYGGVKNLYALGNGVVSAKDPVAQGGVTLSFENGAYFDLWLSRRLSGAAGNVYGNESDFTLGWKGAVGSVSADVGIAFFDLYRTARFDRNDVSQFFGEISPQTPWAIGPTTLSPYVRLEVISSTGLGFRNEPVYFAGIRHTWPINERFSVLQRLQVSEQPDLPGVAGGTVVSYKVQIPYKTDMYGITVTPSYERIHPFIDGRPKSNVFGLQLSRAF